MWEQENEHQKLSNSVAPGCKTFLEPPSLPATRAKINFSLSGGTWKEKDLSSTASNKPSVSQKSGRVQQKKKRKRGVQKKADALRKKGWKITFPFFSFKLNRERREIVDKTRTEDRDFARFLRPTTLNIKPFGRKLPLPTTRYERVEQRSTTLSLLFPADRSNCDTANRPIGILTGCENYGTIWRLNRKIREKKKNNTAEISPSLDIRRDKRTSFSPKRKSYIRRVW